MMLVCLTALALAQTAQTVQDDAHGISFTVPAGYTKMAETPPSMIQMLSRGEQGEASYMAISFIDLGGTLGPESKLLHDVVEKSAREAAEKTGAKVDKFTWRTVAWQGVELEVVETWLTVQDIALVTMAVQLPVKKSAVQLQLVAHAENEAELAKDLQALLSTLKAEMSVQSEKDRDAELSRRIGEVLGVVFGLGGVALVYYFGRRRRK